jgi:hypothetical protein
VRADPLPPTTDTILKTITAAIVLSVTALLATPVVAGPDRYSLLLTSKHLGVGDEIHAYRFEDIKQTLYVREKMRFNEFNPGLFLTYEKDGYDLTIGTFYNSYETISLSAFAAVPFYRTEDVSIDLFGGLAWYPSTGLTFPVTLADDVIPLAGLQGRYKNLFVQVIPSDGVAADVIVTAGVTYAVK